MHEHFRYLLCFDIPNRRSLNHSPLHTQYPMCEQSGNGRENWNIDCTPIPKRAAHPCYSPIPCRKRSYLSHQTKSVHNNSGVLDLSVYKVVGYHAPKGDLTA